MGRATIECGTNQDVWLILSQPIIQEKVTKVVPTKTDAAKNRDWTSYVLMCLYAHCESRHSGVSIVKYWEAVEARELQSSKQKALTCSSYCQRLLLSAWQKFQSQHHTNEATKAVQHRYESVV